MKATDVMIGDWVVCNGTPMQIMEIFSDSITAECWPYDYNDLEPIPLTPEILAKNGFEKSTTYSFYNAMEVEEWNLTLGKSVFTVTTPDNPEIQLKEVLFRTPDLDNFFFHILYNKDLMVHELQHALRLCGIEKEIEL